MISIIEKTKNDEENIKILIDLNLVIFEETVLLSNNLKYIIIHTPKIKVYDVIIEDFKKGILISYISFNKLSNSTLKYFNLIKNEEYSDNFGNTFKCIKHTIEYEI